MAITKSWSFLRSWLRRTYNKKVHEYFKDLDPNIDPDNSTGRSASKAACLIGANDSQSTASLKMQIFEQFLENDGEIFYSIPASELWEYSVEGEPQIMLNFREQTDDAKRNNRYPIRGRVSIRISEDDISSDSGIKNWARKVRDEFARPPFYYQKGKIKFTYIDKKKGYLFILAADEENEIRDVIRKTMSLKGETPDWNRLRESKSKQNFSERKTKRVGGETIVMPKLRQEGRVYFSNAQLNVTGLARNKVLVDTTGRFKEALYYA
jgi:hypothetical protein